MRSNKSLLTALTASLAACCSPAVFAQANVDLNSWSEITNNSNGFWDVDNNGVEGSGPDGAFVRQEINGAPTIFLSPDKFINTSINGSFSVDPNSDDDFIGFVFGVQNPSVSTIDALLFDWKQGSQAGATEGFRLSYVTGDISNSGSTASPYWTHTSTADTTFQSLGTNYDANYGWLDDGSTKYDFTLDYSTTNITINVAGGQFAAGGLEVFAVDVADVSTIFPGGLFPNGQFGFYNFSQAGVNYESFTRTDDPVLATTPTDGGTLNFGNVRVTGSSTDSIDINNNGGPGSTLNGAAPTPTDPAFSLITAPDNFVLGEGQGTSFEYSFSPATRGVFSEIVNVSSNDPADADGHDVTLQGTGVGPVYDANNSLAFNDVDANNTQSLFITLNNMSGDGNLGDLTDLTLVSITIDGTDTDLFSLVGFSAGTTIAAAGDYTLEVAFSGDGELGLKQAFLFIETDEGALLGGDGNNYQIDLTANAVPEPTTLTLLALAGFALTRRMRKKGQSLI